MKRVWQIAAAFGLAAFAAAAAQPPGLVLVKAGAAVDGRLGEASARAADGARHDCYAVNTQPGQTLTVTLRSDAFAPRLSVGRGAACPSAKFQYLGSGSAGGKAAKVSFKAGGGRYLVMARATGERLGAYALEIEGGGEEAAGQQVSSLDRREIMKLQVEKRRAEVAAEQARLQAQAEERARQAAERARQAELARLEEDAWLAEEEAAATEEATWDDPQPAQPNVALAFMNAFADATQKHEMERQRQQQVLDRINAEARAVAASRERAERARLAQQQTSARLAQERREAIDREQRLAEARRAEQQRAAERERVAQRQAAERAHLADATPPPSSSSAQKSCTSRTVSGEARSNRLATRAEAEAFVRNQPNFCPDGSRAPLGAMQCSSIEESVPDSSCLTSLKACPKRTRWTCSAKYTCSAPLVTCIGGGASRQ